MSKWSKYERGWTIEQHRDELIERLGKAIKEINALQSQVEQLTKALTGLVEASEKEFGPSPYNTAMNKARAALKQSQEPQIKKENI